MVGAYGLLSREGRWQHWADITKKRTLSQRLYRVRKHNLFQTGIDMVQFSQLCQSCFRKSQSLPPRWQGPRLPEPRVIAIGFVRHVSDLPSACLSAAQARRRRKVEDLSGSLLSEAVWEQPGRSLWVCCKSGVQRAGCFCPWGLQACPQSKVLYFCSRYFVPAHWFTFQLYWPESSLGEGATNLNSSPPGKEWFKSSGLHPSFPPWRDIEVEALSCWAGHRGHCVQDV